MIRGEKQNILKQILVEMMLNEITADQAYDKYYNTMSREDFDRIVSLSTKPDKPDKWIQFFLSAVRDGDSDVDTACETIEAVKNADNLVRQTIKNKFAQGEYEHVDDIATDVEYLGQGGTILSRKSLAKQGLKILKENERWVATCTTNWTANNHYFGKEGARWCTASDRNGNWDGFKMFYDYSNGGALIQFKWKGEVEAENYPAATSIREYMDNPFDEEKGFIGNKILERDHIFQVAIRENLTIRDAENFFNKNCDGLNGIKTFCGEEMFSVLTDKELISGLMKETSEMHAEEDKYLKMGEELESRRKEASQRKALEKSKEINEKRKGVVIEYWKNFIETKGYENPELIEQILSDSLGGAIFSKYSQVIGNEENGIYSLSICGGFRKYASASQISVNGKIRFKVLDIERNFPSFVIGGVVVIYDTLNKKVLNVIGPFETDEETTSLNTYNLWSVDKKIDGKFEVINVFNCNNGEDLVLYILDHDTMSLIDLHSEGYKWPTMIVTVNDGRVLAITDDNDYFFINREEGKVESKNDNERVIPFRSGDNFILSDENGQFFYDVMNDDDYSSGEPKKINCKKRIKEVEKYHRGEYTHMVLINVKFDDGTYNMLRTNSDVVEPIFGVDGIDYKRSEYYNYETIYIKKGEYLYSLDCIYPDQEYILKQVDNAYHVIGNPTNCDKYGKTDEEKTYAKNFNVHQQAGEYDHGEDWGRAAMKDWNDEDLPGYNDRKLDDMGVYRYDNSEDGDSYYMREKDPEAGEREWKKLMSIPRAERTPEMYKAFGDFDMHNTYKTNNRGKDIEQGWNDEDEIPARMSDRVVREGFEKMKSIWNRLGLND